MDAVQQARDWIRAHSGRCCVCRSRKTIGWCRGEMSRALGNPAPSGAVGCLALPPRSLGFITVILIYTGFLQTALVSGFAVLRLLRASYYHED